MERIMRCPRCQREIIYKSYSHYMEIVDQYLRSHHLQRDMLWPYDFEKAWDEGIIASNAAKRAVNQTILNRGSVKWRGISLL